MNVLVPQQTWPRKPHGAQMPTCSENPRSGTTLDASPSETAPANASEDSTCQASAWDILRNTRVHPHDGTTEGGSVAASAGVSAAHTSPAPASAAGVRLTAEVEPSLSGMKALQPGVAERLRVLLTELEARGGEKHNKHQKPWTPGQWCMMGCMLGWEETGRRCINEATTVGVISALLMGITFPALLSPPQLGSNPFSVTAGDKVPPTTLLRLLSYGLFLSVNCSVVCVLLCAILVMQLNIATTAEDIRGFFIRFEFVTVLNVVSFNISLACLAMTAVTAMAINFHPADTLVSLLTLLGAWVPLGIIALHTYAGFSLRNMKRHYRQLLEVQSKLGSLAPHGSGSAVGAPQPGAVGAPQPGAAAAGAGGRAASGAAAGGYGASEAS